MIGIIYVENQETSLLKYMKTDSELLFFIKNIIKKIHINIFLKKIFVYFNQIKWGLTVTSIDSKKDLIIVKNKKNRDILSFPYAGKFSTDSSQLKILSLGYRDFMLEKYELIKGEINSDSIIVDCGGFIGGFSLAAIGYRNASQSYYIEPTPLTRKCASINFSLYEISDKVTIIEGGLGSKNGLKKLNFSSSQTNNSFLTPDADATGIEKIVSVYTIDFLFKKFSIKANKVFLKLEAEGFEFEILKGLKEQRPRCISIDISPEMNGKSPIEEITNYLIARGYKLMKYTKRVAFYKYFQ